MADKTNLYKKLIIRALSFGKQLPVNDIALEIGKSLPLTTRMVVEMEAEGVLTDNGLANSTGGRRALTYSLNPGVVNILSISMDQYTTKLSVIDPSKLEIKNFRKYDLPLIKNDNSASLLAQIIQDYLSEEKINKDDLLGAGIAMPGFIDVEKGINYIHLPVKEPGFKSLTGYLSAKTGLHVLIDNDSSAIALAEYVIGKAVGKKDSLIINFGWGVGLGMILDGKLYRGSSGIAGEFSHIPLFNNNKLCECGKTGCLETEASMHTIVDGFQTALKSGRVSCIKSLPPDPEESSKLIVEAALSGDLLSIELITQAAYDIGRGLAILIHILNPEQIVISGIGAQAGNMLIAPIQQAISKFCIPSLAAYTDIVLSGLSRDAETFGAAALVVEKTAQKWNKLFGKLTSIE